VKIDITNIDLKEIKSLTSTFEKLGYWTWIDNSTAKSTFLYIGSSKKIYNQEIFNEFLNKEFEVRKRHGIPFAVITCEGDDDAILNAVRNSDIIGQNETGFKILLKHTDNTQEAERRVIERGGRILGRTIYGKPKKDV